MAKYAVAVSGASGRVSITIVRGLLEADYDVHALVRTHLPAEHPLAYEKVAVATMDLATISEQDVLRWLDTVRPIAFIHAAALADVSDCERQPSLAYLMNAHVTRVLARACVQSQTHFIMLSTEHVFSGTPHPEILLREEDAVHPLNTYGKSKVQGELATQEECAGKTPWTICRVSAVYGSIGDPGPWYRPDFVQWLRSTLQQNKTLRIVVDQVNSPLYTLDLTKILVAVVERKLQGVYHVAGSAPISRYDFARQVARIFDLDETLIQPALTSELDVGPQRPLNTGLSVAKISRASGIHPLSPQDGLVSYRSRICAPPA